MAKTYDMWAVKLQGKHKPFAVFEKSHHAKQKCAQLAEHGYRCKIKKVEVIENDQR